MKPHGQVRRECGAQTLLDRSPLAVVSGTGVAQGEGSDLAPTLTTCFKKLFPQHR